MIRSLIAQVITMLVLINMVLSAVHYQDFLENNGWINIIDPCSWFQWYFRYWSDRRSEDDETKIKRWKKM